MKARYANLLWGLALIAAGALFLAQNFGLISDLSPIFWAVFFTGLSLVFFASYFLNGLEQWWWLIPAMVTGGIAVTLSLAAAGFDDSFIGVPILASMSVPFLAAYLVKPRENWWALIPAWVMGVVTVLALIGDRAPGELMGSFVLFAIALPFLVVFLTDRRRWWALIPGGVLGVVAFLPLLSLAVSGEAMGPLVMFLFALPFLVVYFAWAPAWWALIPAGFFATIGVVALLGVFSQGGPNWQGPLTGVLFLGWAATFFALWLRRGTAPTFWAKYPALALALAAGVAFFLGVPAVRFLWPVVIIAVGLLLLYRSFGIQRG